MFQKLRRKGCYIPKQELHIMLLLRYGKTNPMTVNLTFGLSDV